MLARNQYRTGCPGRRGFGDLQFLRVLRVLCGVHLCLCVDVRNDPLPSPSPPVPSSAPSLPRARAPESPDPTAPLASYPASSPRASTPATSASNFSRSRAHTPHTSPAVSPASPVRTHRCAVAAPPPRALRVRPRTPPPEGGLRPADRVSHSPPAPDPPPHAAPSQTLTSPARDALPQSRSAPATSRPASSSAPPATTGSNAVSERTSAPDTKSETPATPPPIAPTRAALHRGLFDPFLDPPSSLPTAPATPPPSEAIPLAHPASKSGSLSVKTMNTQPADIQPLRPKKQTPFPLRLLKAPAPRPKSAQYRRIPA